VYAQYKLNVKTNPKAVDLEIGDQTIRGIYRVDGDKLTVCFSAKAAPQGGRGVEPGKEKRPSEFSTKKGSERIMFVFVREKEKK